MMFATILRLLGISKTRFIAYSILLAVLLGLVGAIKILGHETAAAQTIAAQQTQIAIANRQAYDGAMSAIIGYAQIQQNVERTYDNARAEADKKISSLAAKHVSSDLGTDPSGTIARINTGAARLFSSISCASSITCAEDTNTAPGPN